MNLSPVEMEEHTVAHYSQLICDRIVRTARLRLEREAREDAIRINLLLRRLSAPFSPRPTYLLYTYIVKKSLSSRLKFITK